MQSIGAKLDNQTHEKVRDKCNDRGCTTSEYMRELISRDLQGENQPVAEPIELPDSGWKLPAGSIFKDGGIDLPNGGVIIPLDDYEVKRIEKCVGHKCQSNKELSDAIMRIAEEVGKR